MSYKDYNFEYVINNSFQLRVNGHPACIEDFIKKEPESSTLRILDLDDHGYNCIRAEIRGLFD